MIYVAFLRAINVGGHASLRMSDLKDAFEAAGCRNVRTLIQNGNVIFESDASITAALHLAIARQLARLAGQDAAVIYRSKRELHETLAVAPFARPVADSNEKRYLGFLAEKPRASPELPLISARVALLCYRNR